jgi:hypothetical protein
MTVPTFIDGAEMSASQFLRFMREEEAEGNREYDRDRYAGQQLVRLADVYVTPETALAIEQEDAA